MKYVYVLILILLASTVSATAYGGVLLQEGQTKTFYSATRDYNLRVLAVTDAREEVIFELDGERSKPLKEREKHRFSDGSVVSVAEVLPNEGEEAVGDLVHFYFVTGSGVMEATKVSGQGLSYIEDAEYDLGRLGEQFSEVTEPKYARITFDDAPQKECIGDGNCNDGNACTKDRCVNGECVHDFAKGCSAGGRCIPFQTVVESGEGKRFYCSVSGLIEQKIDGDLCSSDFECIHKCLDGVCAEEVVIEMPEEPSPERQPEQEWFFADFFRWLFGWE